MTLRYFVDQLGARFFVYDSLRGNRVVAWRTTQWAAKQEAKRRNERESVIEEGVKLFRSGRSLRDVQADRTRKGIR